MDLPGIGQAVIISALIFLGLGVALGLIWGFALGVEWANKKDVGK